MASARAAESNEYQLVSKVTTSIHSDVHSVLLLTFHDPFVNAPQLDQTFLNLS
jgi:hypothetical protein